MNDTQKKKDLRLGVNVLIILAVLTGLEFVLAVAVNFWPALVLVALIKAGIVIQHYMHLPRVFGEEGGH